MALRSALTRRSITRPGGFLVTLQLLALVLLGLHLYVRTLPPTSAPIPGPADAESAWWGVWPITFLPLWAVWAGVGAVLGAIGLWWGLPANHRAVDRTPESNPADLTWRQLWPYGLGALLLLVAFYCLPVAHTRWGDAFMLAKGIAFPDPALRLTHSWQAPLDVFLHSQLWRVLHEPLGWEDAMPAYRLLSPLAGVLYLGAGLALARQRWLAPAWLTLGLFASLGLLQLFFGYVENYSFAAAGVLAYLWLGVEVLRGRRPLWLAAAVLALTHATHPSTIVLAPSLLYLGWSSGRRNLSWQRSVLEIALPMLAIGSATFAGMEAAGHGLAALLSTDRPGGGDASWFVPLVTTTTRWERYTFLSWPHLRDLLNQQLLVAPAVLPALAVTGLGAWRGGLTPLHPLEGTALRFLAVATASYWLFVTVWNPDYGGQRDWDLFSLAALPATLLVALALPRLLPARSWLWGGALPLLLLQAWHTAAWIYQNTLPWQWPE